MILSDLVSFNDTKYHVVSATAELLVFTDIYPFGAAYYAGYSVFAYTLMTGLPAVLYGVVCMGA